MFVQQLRIFLCYFTIYNDLIQERCTHCKDRNVCTYPENVFITYRAGHVEHLLGKLYPTYIRKHYKICNRSGTTLYYVLFICDMHVYVHVSLLQTQLT